MDFSVVKNDRISVSLIKNGGFSDLLNHGRIPKIDSFSVEDDSFSFELDREYFQVKEFTEEMFVQLLETLSYLETNKIMLNNADIIVDEKGNAYFSNFGDAEFVEKTTGRDVVNLTQYALGYFDNKYAKNLLSRNLSAIEAYEMFTRIRLEPERAKIDVSRRTLAVKPELRAQIFEWIIDLWTKKTDIPLNKFRHYVGLFDFYMTNFGEDMETSRCWKYALCLFMIFSTFMGRINITLEKGISELLKLKIISTKEELTMSTTIILENLEFELLFDTNDDFVHFLKPKYKYLFRNIRVSSDIKKFEVVKILNEGAYGVVSRVKDKDGNIACLKKAKDPLDISIEREIKFLKMIDSPFVVKVIDYENIWFTMKCYSSSLKDFRKKSPKDLNLMIKQLLQGLRDIHKLGIVHADIKPTNILVDKDENILYADFGMSFKEGDKTNHEIVTLYYRPPEICHGGFKTLHTSLDIWSLGCTICEIVTEEILFPGNFELDHLFKIYYMFGTPEKEVKRGFPRWKPLDFYKNFDMDKNLLNLLYDMIKINPDERITAQEALDKYF